MTTIGVLTPATERHIIDHLTWGEVRFGVDSVADVIRLVDRDALDVLVVDASVAFLTAELLALYPDRIRRIAAICANSTSEEWARGFAGVDVFRSVTEIAARVAPTPVPPGATDSHESESPVATLVAVWGPVGAPGITTTAISLAAIAAQSGLRTLLCDADTRGSAISIALALDDDTPGLAAACRLAGRGELSAEELARLATRYSRDSWHFDVLTGLPRASRWATIEPRKLRDVLAMARGRYDIVVVDVGFGIEENEWIDDAPQRDGAARELLRTADHVVAVGRPDAVGVARLIRALDEVVELCATPQVVLNAGSAVSLREATEALHRFTSHTVCASIPRDSRGGVEDAVARATGSSSPFRRLAGRVGVTASRSKRHRVRRR